MKKLINPTIIIFLLALASCNSVYVTVPPANLDSVPVITVGVAVVNGSTDIPDNGVMVSGTTVNVSLGATISILGNAKNVVGGVKQFSISVIKFPEVIPTTSTVLSPYSTNSAHTQPTVLSIFGVGTIPNNPVQYKFVNANDKLIVHASATNFNGGTNEVTVTFVIGQSRRRISGASFFHLDKKDGNDKYYSEKGFLLVEHDPGCGVKGNDGTDKFTFSSSLLNDHGFTIENFEFHQFWPTERRAGNPWSWAGAGSYGARNSPASLYTIGWNNSCVDPYGNKKLYYIASFIVSMPPGFALNELTYDPDPPFNSYQAPVGYQWDEASAPVIDSQLEPSGFAGQVYYCNITNSAAKGVLEITANKETAYTGANGAETMTEKIPVSFEPSAGGIPSIASFKTAMNYKQGTWKITQAKITGLTGNLPGLPLTVSLPGPISTPILDFSGGTCNR